MVSVPDRLSSSKVILVEPAEGIQHEKTVASESIYVRSSNVGIIVLSSDADVQLV